MGVIEDAMNETWVLLSWFKNMCHWIVCKYFITIAPSAAWSLSTGSVISFPCAALRSWHTVWHYLPEVSHCSGRLLCRRLHLSGKNLFFYPFNHFCSCFWILSDFKGSSQSWIVPFDEGLTETNYYSPVVFRPLFIFYYITALLPIFIKLYFISGGLFSLLLLKATLRLEIKSVSTTSQHRAHIDT